MKKRILFSGYGACFPYMKRFLEDKYELYFMDMNRDLCRFEKNLFIVPKVTDPEYWNELIQIIIENNIDYYVPGIDEELLKTSDLYIRTVSPSQRFMQLCLDKYRLMEELQYHYISTVKTIKGNIFIKPNVGRGSRDTYEVMGIEDKITQEYLEGDEYTVSVVVNNLNKLIAIVPKRVIEKKGVTIQAVTVKNYLIERVCQEIVDKLKPHGIFNVQLKMVNNIPKIFEINPRYSTTTVLTCEAGVNEIDLFIENYDKEDVERVDFKEGVHLFRRLGNYFY